MPDPSLPTKPVPDPEVELTKHRVDWATIDNPGELTEQRLSALGDSIAHGAWYFNAAYTVYAPTPSAEFL